MSQLTPNEGSLLGFLTVVESSEWGCTGGYLLISGSGRPVEFHCTAPVRVTRAQEILYGPTLRPVLFGEQMGRALLDKARRKPACICTDLAEILALRPMVDLPVVMVRPSAAGDAAVAPQPHDDTCPAVLGWRLGQPCPAGPVTITALDRFAEDVEVLRRMVGRAGMGR
ncbi:MAG: hypothetical protein KatS3mg109_1120 [Pirellulaceae bacterium]|nr:MAG: hypothetical protein KatS3mg109_1120 [Pirellulaceae bacterium]